MKFCFFIVSLFSSSLVMAHSENEKNYKKYKNRQAARTVCNRWQKEFCRDRKCNYDGIYLVPSHEKSKCGHKLPKDHVNIVHALAYESVVTLKTYPCCLYGKLPRTKRYCRDKKGHFKQGRRLRKGCYPPERKARQNAREEARKAYETQLNKYKKPCRSNQKMPHWKEITWKDITGRRGTKCLPSCGGAKRDFCALNDCKGFQLASGGSCSEYKNYIIKKVPSYQLCCMRKRK